MARHLGTAGIVRFRISGGVMKGQREGFGVNVRGWAEIRGWGGTSAGLQGGRWRLGKLGPPSVPRCVVCVTECGLQYASQREDSRRRMEGCESDQRRKNLPRLRFDVGSKWEPIKARRASAHYSHLSAYLKFRYGDLSWCLSKMNA